jgi:hypothetical protein
MCKDNNFHTQEHQLLTPLVTILGLFIEGGDPAEELFGELSRNYRASRTGQQNVERYFNRLRAPKERMWKMH